MLAFNSKYAPVMIRAAAAAAAIMMDTCLLLKALSLCSSPA